jgi:hypothetical protein
MAYNMDLQAGDVILQVGDRPATTPGDVMAQFTRAKTAPGDLVAILVRGKEGAKWKTLWVGSIDPNQLVARLPEVSTAGVASSVAAQPR